MSDLPKLDRHIELYASLNGSLPRLVDIYHGDEWEKETDDLPRLPPLSWGKIPDSYARLMEDLAWTDHRIEETRKACVILAEAGSIIGIVLGIIIGVVIS